MEIDLEYLDNLQHAWSATILLQNDKMIDIWYTALPMRKRTIKKVVSVSSDYPKCAVKKDFIIN